MEETFRANFLCQTESQYQVQTRSKIAEMADWIYLVFLS